jgi:tetratricopeptide (TPR) repeat protein
MTPEYALAWKTKGEILSYDLGRYEESIDAYERALPMVSGAGPAKEMLSKAQAVTARPCRLTTMLRISIQV